MYDFVKFLKGKVVFDDLKVLGIEIGWLNDMYCCICIELGFGKMIVFVIDGYLFYLFGCEMIGYEVVDFVVMLK